MNEFQMMGMTEWISDGEDNWSLHKSHGGQNKQTKEMGQTSLEQAAGGGGKMLVHKLCPQLGIPFLI